MSNSSRTQKKCEEHQPELEQVIHQVMRSTFLTLVISMIICLLTAATSQSQTRADNTKKVLVLNSYHRGFYWSDNIMSAIQSEFDKSDLSVELFFEYMDTYRHTAEDVFPHLRQLYETKYKNIKFDLIISSDEAALPFLLTYRDQLFPGVQHVFCGVNNFHEFNTEGYKSLTGLVETHERQTTVEIALKLHPLANQIVVINDEVSKEITRWEYLGRARSQFKDRIKFVNFSLKDMSMDQMLAKLETLGSESIVLLLGAFKDAEGNRYLIKEASELIRQHCKVPIYIVSEMWIGYGTVGGYLSHPSVQGQIAAQLAIRILKGEPADNIPVIPESPHRYLFDYEQLKHFKIPLTSLPEGSTFINEPESLYYTYKEEIRLVILTIMILLLMVLFLVINMIYRRKAERALQKITKEQQIILDSVSATIWYKNTNNELIRVNKAAAQLVGMKPSDIEGKSVYELFGDAADSYYKDDLEVIMTGKPKLGITEQIKLPSGDKRWMQTDKVPYRDDKGKIIGVIVFSVDITKRKKIEQAVMESEAIYRRAIENAEGVPYQLRFSDNKYVFIGSGMEELIGLPKEKLSWDNLNNLIIDVNLLPPSTSTKLVDWRKAFFAGDKELAKKYMDAYHQDISKGLVDRHRSDINIVTPAGEKKWLNDCSLFVKDEVSGEVVGSIGILQDITERKQAEEAVAHSETIYRRAIENARGVPYQLRWSDDKYVFMGSGIEEVTGIPSEKFTSETWMNSVIGSISVNFENTTKDTNDFRKAFNDGRMDKNKSFQVDTHIRTQNGEEKWVTDCFLLTTDKKTGKVTGSMGILQDITERKLIEQELQKTKEGLEIKVQDRTALLKKTNERLEREIIQHTKAEENLQVSEQRYALAQRAAHIGSWDSNIATEQIVWSEEIEPMFGFSNGQFGGTQEAFVECVHPDDRQHVKDSLDACLNENKEYAIEHRIIWPDGTIRWVSETGSIVSRDENAKPTRMVGIVEDITERKRNEHDLLTYQRQLRSLALESSLAEERLRRRIAIEIHDNIGQDLAMSKIKLESFAKSLSLKKPVKVLEEIRDSMTKLIENTRSLTFELSPPVLYELGFDAALEWLTRYAQEQYGFSVKFKNNSQHDPMEDNLRVLFFQASRELVVNIAKHAKASNVEISIQNIDSQIHVTVEDDGIGFDASQIDHQDHRKGGFGLFSIRERLNQIGGRLIIKSEPGHGTKVTLAAPIEKHTA